MTKSALTTEGSAAHPGSPCDRYRHPRRSWYGNLLAHPRFTFHLKHGVRADLAATAVPVTDDAMKGRVFGYIVDDFNQPHNPARIPQPTRREDWKEGSPLMEIKLELGES